MREKPAFWICFNQLQKKHKLGRVPGERCGKVYYFCRMENTLTQVDTGLGARLCS